MSKNNTNKYNVKVKWWSQIIINSRISSKSIMRIEILIIVRLDAKTCWIKFIILQIMKNRKTHSSKWKSKNIIINMMVYKHAVE